MRSIVRVGRRAASISICASSRLDRAQLGAQTIGVDGVELLARHGRLPQSRARRGELAGDRLCGLEDEAMRLLQRARFGLGATQ